MTESQIVPWLWRSGVGLPALVVAVGAILVIALALGFNSPRPLRSPDWEAADLPLVLKAPSNTTARRLLGRSYADLTLEIEMVPLSSADPDLTEYGLIYRAQDTDHYYAFVIGSDGYYAVLRMAGEEETQLMEWQLFPHIHRDGQANRLRVTCTGSACDFLINDEYATTIEDNVWLEGDVGLWARGFDGASAAVQFQNARVWVE